MSSYDRKSNPYLKIGFWNLFALSIIMLLFFPWSFLICLVIYGAEETKLIALALIEDFVKTFLLITAVVATIFITAIVLVVMWLKSPDETIDAEGKVTSEIIMQQLDL